MVYICIDTGSRAKGYAVESSDIDYHIYTKCDRETFEKSIDNKELLKNRHAKDEAGNDVKYVDLYKGLIGILTGKSPELGIFSKCEDFKNSQLYEFVTKLTMASIIKIIYALMRYKILNSAKGLLQIMFNYVYVEYYLDYKRLPKSTKILNMLFNVGDEVKFTINKNKQLIVNNSNVLDLNKNEYKIDETLTLFVKNVKLLKLYVELMQRGEYQEEWTKYFQKWKLHLQDRLQHVPEPQERADIRHNIIMYALNERGPVMPEDENLYC
ncbi:he65 [Maruca vitrata nucleopolyhedrovirus]|uniref:He65 n=1 Tax=Maruca vitrata nucleopolyhedrovirus TaxID=1307954 RepID=A1YRE4_9ABAC|nr:he65 [Maruca vitrata nucleopolyhedrovirus]ABL76034.1 he65 [Maruca vitrata nucleopolyhedrovirus]